MDNIQKHNNHINIPSSEIFTPYLQQLILKKSDGLIIVAAWSKGWNDFVRSNAGIVGSNPNRGMYVYVRVYSVFLLFCV
jgi:hypothetical protein